ncbi:hypothetical protein [Rhizobium mayense]|uniref:Uncharacterized protein n=1 Tax=Rhizobium mayense TaxID=1312184 RepID=A0ABT7JV28_9HYPH|nr:hypothetical protein [Rhizobium mayense]MDL2398779.1 hypothetical protein [Rhizobium mayense]
MSIEGRLYVVARESVNGQFSTYGDLAAKVHEAAPAEFTYNRLEEKHVMQVSSIVPYVSLIHLIGLLRVNGHELYESILDSEPSPEGAEVVINQRAIAKLEESGFNRANYLRAIHDLLRPDAIVLPTLRDVYQAMGLNLTELHFLQLCALGGVRRNFGFSLITRRMMIPTEVHP